MAIEKKSKNKWPIGTCSRGFSGQKGVSGHITMDGIETGTIKTGTIKTCTIKTGG